MPISIKNQVVIVGNHQIAPADFTDLVQRHLNRVPGTQDIEDYGKRVQTGQRLDDEWKEVVRNVIAWGGGQRFVLSPVMKNSSSVIRNSLQEAARRLSEVPPDIGSALDAVQWINGLGVSFGSKVLRFLRPDICPVLDRLISEQAGYARDRNGYCLYVRDASEIARFLEVGSIHNPMQRGQDVWFAGDVDMALFAKIQGWQYILERTR